MQPHVTAQRHGGPISVPPSYQPLQQARPFGPAAPASAPGTRQRRAVCVGRRAAHRCSAAMGAQIMKPGQLAAERRGWGYGAAGNNPTKYVSPYSQRYLTKDPK